MARVCLGLLCVAALFSLVSGYTFLDHYVKTYDELYAWKIANTIDAKDYTAYNIFLTSQRWLTQGEVLNGGYIWKHWLQVIVPKQRLGNADLAFLYIDGGSNARFENPPTEASKIVSQFAVNTGTIGVDLGQIPNQPIYFAGDPNRGRSEDHMIAYTWSHWINNTYEYDWLARMPMTKASIRALDTVQAFVKTLPGVTPIDRFVVGGASKRGWTTWMVGGMDDPRVVGIVPIVAPVANLVPQINEMWQSYGNWSFALEPYLEMDLMGWLNLPRFTEMLDIIDPLSYPNALSKIPKYVVCALGDEFFMPDAAQYYWTQLRGDKYLYLVPNAEHSMAGHITDVLGSAQQFYLSIFYNQPKIMPTYSWEISADGTTVTLTTETDHLVKAVAYHSYNNSERDWRLITCTTGINCINPALWGKTELQPVSEGVYQFTISPPENGKYSAFVIEVEFDFGWTSFGPGRRSFKISSDMSIVPRGKYPYEPCPKNVCQCGYACNGN